MNANSTNISPSSRANNVNDINERIKILKNNINFGINHIA